MFFYDRDDEANFNCAVGACWEDATAGNVQKSVTFCDTRGCQKMSRIFSRWEHMMEPSALKTTQKCSFMKRMMNNASIALYEPAGRLLWCENGPKLAKSGVTGFFLGFYGFLKVVHRC